jgi:TonB family protein
MGYSCIANLLRVSGFLIGLLGAAGVSAQPVSSRAQGPDRSPTDSGAQVEIRVPELERFVEAEYPAEARAQGLEADVVLSLDIDEQGQVTRASVTTPAGHGFDEAAIQAAEKFVFRPARRGDKPVKARILYRYSFHFQTPPAPVEEKASRAKLAGFVRITGQKEPVAGAKVELSRGGVRAAALLTSADGRFSFPELAPGNYQLRVVAAGFEPYSIEEKLGAGEELEVSYGLLPHEEGADVITITGERPSREVTRRTVTRRELSRIPGTSGDALRAVQNLPGVARPPALSGVLVVRGNADQTTPVFIDGMWLPNVYHFGGLSSVVPTEMLDEVNFYPGNFSVRYGRALAGVVDAHLRETRQDERYHGLLQLDLIDARALVEGPLPLLKGWNFIAGLRRSHVDAWLAPLLDGRDTYITAAPVYYDYQFIADRRFANEGYLRIGLLGFDDRFALISKDTALGGELETISATTGLGAIYQQRLSSKVKLHLTQSAARNHERFSLSTLLIDLVAIGSVGRGELEWQMWRNVTLRTGYDLLVAPYRVKGNLPEDAGPNAPDVGSFVTQPTQVFDRSATFFAPALYSEMDLHPSQRTQLLSGVRVDYTRETGRVDVSPRLTVRYDVKPGYPKTTLKAGSGLFHQAPGLVELVLKDKDTELRSLRNFQNSVGVEQQLSERVKFSAEGFFNLLDNLVSRQPGSDGALRYNNYGKGRIFGGEFMLRYDPDERFFGWVSYTLSRSERTWVPGEPSRLFYLDQTHILTALGSLDLGRGWEVGLRFRLVSGNLYTPCYAGLFSSTGTSYLCGSGPLFSERLPPFHQLDARVDKRWKFGDFTLSAYLDLINAYNRKNPDFIQYNYDFSESKAQTASLPIVPSLGVRGEF